jgi:hypothetical protein
MTGYSIQDKNYITKSLIVKPQEVPIRALLSTYFIDVYFAFDQTLKKEVYNIIVEINELPLR